MTAYHSHTQRRDGAIVDADGSHCVTCVCWQCIDCEQCLDSLGHCDLHAGVEDGTHYKVHVHGPDDVLDAPTKERAERLAEEINDLGLEHVTAHVVVPGEFDCVEA